MANNPLEEIVAARLRAVMAESAWENYGAMAEICKTTPSVVSNWMNAYNLPKVRQIAILCKATGITMDWLYRGHLGAMDPKLANRLEERIRGDVGLNLPNGRSPNEPGLPAAIRKQADLEELTMRYPIAIEIGTETAAYGVVVPDLPGCFSARDTLDDAVTAAEEAAAAWINATLDAGADVPAPSSIEAVRALPEYTGWAIGVITVDPAAIDSAVERVNITLPRRVLLRLDAQARAAGESRSGYIAHLTMEGRGERHA